ncbi:MAG: methyltransferase, partial [Acidobacteriota bacterium]
MHAAVFAFVIACWLLAGLVILLRKRHAGLREVERDPAWKIGLVFQALGLLIIWAAPRPRFTPILPLGTTVEVALAVVALALAAGAAWLLLAAKRDLGRQFAYQARLVEGHELVTTGAYGLVRHPMYTAVLAM